MKTSEVTITCPKGYEERMIAYAQEAIKIAIREDEMKKVQLDVDTTVEVITSELAPAKIDGVSVVEEPIEEPIIPAGG